MYFDVFFTCDDFLVLSSYKSQNCILSFCSFSGNNILIVILAHLTLVG